MSFSLHYPLSFLVQSLPPYFFFPFPQCLHSWSASFPFPFSSSTFSPSRADTVGKGKRSKGEDSALRKREGNVKRNSRRSVSRCLSLTLPSILARKIFIDNFFQKTYLIDRFGYHCNEIRSQS